MTQTNSLLKTRLTELLGIRYPIVQTGMGWVSDAKLTAATSEAGGLGILAGGLMNPDELRQAIRDIRALTDCSFGVNLRAEQPSSAEMTDILLEEGVKVASFALAPKAELITKLKAAGVVVIPSIGARRHAEKVAALGVDAVVAQGGEGGGHTGAVPTSLLTPQVVDAVDIPVIAAGGFFDGRGLVAALAYGAEGIAMGTRFMLTKESPVADKVKQRYLAASVTDTVVTREIDGVPQRVLNGGPVAELERSNSVTRLTRAVGNAIAFQKMSGDSWSSMLREGWAMKRSHELNWSQVVMSANAPMLYKAGLYEAREDIGVVASGQVVGLIEDIPTCAELIERIVAEASEVLERLNAGNR